MLSSSMVGDDDRSNDDRNALALWLMVVRVVGQGEVGLLGHLKGIFRNSLFRFVEVQILNSKRLRHARGDRALRKNLN